MALLKKVFLLYSVILVIESCTLPRPPEPLPNWLDAQEGLWVLENVDSIDGANSIVGLIVPSREDSSIITLIDHYSDTSVFSWTTRKTIPEYRDNLWQLYIEGYSIAYQEDKERLVLKPISNNTSQAVLHYRYFEIQKTHQLSVDSLIRSIGSSVWKCEQGEQSFYLFVDESYDYLLDEGILRENIAMFSVTITPCIEDSCVTPIEHRKIYANANQRELKIEKIEGQIMFYSIEDELLEKRAGERFICSEQSENRIVLNKIYRGRAEEDIVMERVVSISPNVDSFLRYGEIRRERFLKFNEDHGSE